MLRAAGVGVGDEVVVPAFGDSEPAEAALLAGAVPVFADIDPETYCLDPAAVEAVVSPRTAAVVVVHRFGLPAPIDSLYAVGRRHGLLVLEQSEHGSRSAGLASRRSGPRISTGDCAGCGRRRAVPLTRTRSTSCGFPVTAGRTGTRSRGPSAHGGSTAGCR